jgi:hypothetical protein
MIYVTRFPLANVTEDPLSVGGIYNLNTKPRQARLFADTQVKQQPRYLLQLPRGFLWFG